MKVCSYVHMRLGRMAIHSHRTSVCVSQEIMYRSMCQRLPSENKTIIYLLDAAVPRSLSLALSKAYTYRRIVVNWKLMAKKGIGNNCWKQEHCNNNAIETASPLGRPTEVLYSSPDAIVGIDRCLPMGYRKHRYALSYAFYFMKPLYTMTYMSTQLYSSTELYQ